MDRETGGLKEIFRRIPLVNRSSYIYILISLYLHYSQRKSHPVGGIRVDLIKACTVSEVDIQIRDDKPLIGLLNRVNGDIRVNSYNKEVSSESGRALYLF